MKFIKKIFSLVFLIILITVTFVGYKGYKMYKEATEKTPINDKINEIKKQYFCENLPNIFLFKNQLIWDFYHRKYQISYKSSNFY